MQTKLVAAWHVGSVGNAVILGDTALKSLGMLIYSP